MALYYPYGSRSRGDPPPDTSNMGLSEGVVAYQMWYYDVQRDDSDWPPYPTAPTPPPVTSYPPSTTPPRSNAEQQATVAGEDAVVPIVYGRRRCGAIITAITVFGGDLLLRCVWCIGEVDSVESLTADDTLTIPTVAAPIPLGTLGATHYTGAEDQVIDPTMAAAIAGYNDTLAADVARGLPGVCYSVVRIPADTTTGFPQLNAIVRGLKVRSFDWDSSPQDWVTAYTENPAWHLADFLTNRAYGAGADIDWNEAYDLAAQCEQLVGDPPEKRRLSGITIDTVQPTVSWVEVLRAHAGAILHHEGEQVRIVPDVPLDDSPAADVLLLTSDNVIEGSVSISKLGTSDSPTVVQVSFTNRAEVPWTDDHVRVYADGVREGSVQRRMHSASLPGIYRYSEARREAVRRLNESILADLTINLHVRDEGLRVRPGMLARCTFFPFTDAAIAQAPGWRVLQAQQTAPGRWALSLKKFSLDIFDDTVVARTWAPPSSLIVPPSSGGGGSTPEAPSSVTGLTLAWALFETTPGTYLPRLTAEWTAVAGATSYVATFYEADGDSPEGLTQIQTGSTTETQSTTGAVAPSGLYKVVVLAVGPGGSSEPTSAYISVGESVEPPAGTQPYIIACAYNGKPPAGIDVMRYPVVLAGTLPAGLTGSRAVIETAATATARFDIYLNNNDSPSLGTITFAAGGTVGTFTFPNAVALGTSDVLIITAPASQDATLADIGIALLGTRPS